MARPARNNSDVFARCANYPARRCASIASGAKAVERGSRNASRFHCSSLHGPEPAIPSGDRRDAPGIYSDPRADAGLVETAGRRLAFEVWCGPTSPGMFLGRAARGSAFRKVSLRSLARARVSFAGQGLPTRASLRGSIILSALLRSQPAAQCCSQARLACSILS